MRRTTFRNALTMALGLFLLATSSFAQASGAVTQPSALSAAHRQQLRTHIAEARAKHPQAFVAVRRIHEQANELDANKRGRLAPLTAAFRALGPSGSMAMLEQLVFQSHDLGALRPAARLAYRLGLLEGLGALRDPRAEHALHAMAHESELRPEILRAAVAAYAKLSSPTVERALLKLAAAKATPHPAILRGMAHCRRKGVARFLAARLDKASGRDAIVRLARALGDVANAWAWQTPFVARRGDQRTTTRTALLALIKSYAGPRSRHERQMLQQAVLVVNHPQTINVIDQHVKNGSEDARVALRKLRAKFLKSPLRRHGAR